MKRLSKLLGIVLSFVLAVNIGFGISGVTVSAASNVATVWVVANTDGLGHAFLVVKNNTGSSITVGKYTLQPGKIMTCGKFGNLPDGKVLYYNIEKYRMANKYCNYTPNVALGENISSDQLATLNSKIVTDTKWTVTNNCSSFAERCWNSFSSRDISAGWIDTPSSLSKSIKKYSGYITNYSISEACALSDVWYQSSESSSIQKVSSATGDALSSSSSSSSSR